MKVGDKVTCFHKKERMLSGTVVAFTKDKIRIGYGSFSFYKEEDFNRNECKLYETLDEAVHKVQVKEGIKQGFELAKEALANLLPNENVKWVDYSISAYHDAVILQGVTTYMEGIGHVTEVTGFQVTTTHQIPATYHEPPDCDVESVATCYNIGDAVKVFIETIFKLKSQDYWNQEREPIIDAISF